MKTFLYEPGMRVRVKRGSFPLDPAVLERTGLIVEIDDYRPSRYGVSLDGESEIRDFAEEELEPLTGETRSAEELGATGPNVGPTPSGGSGGQN